MTDDVQRSLGRIEGGLEEFKNHIDSRFDAVHVDLQSLKSVANTAHSTANEAKEYAEGIVKKAGWVGGTIAACVSFLIWFVKMIPVSFAAVLGVH